MNIQPILKRLSAESAVIFPTAFSGAYAAYPNGDRRRRPICWLEMAQFKAIQKEGVLRPEGKGFRIQESAVRKYQSRLNRLHPIDHMQTEQRSHHRALEEKEQFVYDDSLRTVQVNTRITPLRALSKPRRGHARKTLSAAEVEAGERFAKDYEFANMGAMKTQNYECIGQSSGFRLEASDLPDSRLDARNRVMGAMKVMGPGLDRVVTSVCVNELTLERLERTEKWMKDAGFTVLKLGLERLVDYYGTEVGQKKMTH